MPYVLSLDEGTTSARAILFDEMGAIRSVGQKEIEQRYPKPGWVEHDPEEIWSTQIQSALEALQTAKVQAKEVAAIGITNQRETTIVWDRSTGKPIYNAIVWQDRRTSPLCDRWRQEGHGPLIAERTGLVIDAYFSASKIVWILDNVPNARKLAEAGKLAFGTVDSWLVWKLTDGKHHLTDISNASRTMVFNIHTGQWDEELLRLFGIPASMLPEVRSCSEVYGETATSHFGVSLPIAGMAGDQQAALFGQLCLAPGETKTTYGTGCFMLQNTGSKPKASQNRLITTVAYQRPSQETYYALEGSVFIGGAVVQWLRDELGFIKTSADILQLAESVPDSGGICLVPSFAGLGAPHWDSSARGLLIGITRGTNKAHIARAALESIAHQVAYLFDAMKSDSHLSVKEMRVDGGASQNNLLMQIQADLLGITLVRPTISETTALGAAYLAGLAVGFWKGTDELIARQQIDRRFEPQQSPEKVAKIRARWHRALERAKEWEQEDQG